MFYKSYLFISLESIPNYHNIDTILLDPNKISEIFSFKEDLRIESIGFAGRDRLLITILSEYLISDEYDRAYVNELIRDDNPLWLD